MTQFVIIEPGFRGHRMEYLRAALDVAEAEGIDVAVAMSSAGRSSAEFQHEVVSSHGAPELVCLLQEGSSIWLRILDVWRLRRSCPTADWLFLNIDEYLAALLLLPVRGANDVRGIVLRPVMGKSAKSLVKRLIIRCLERRGYSLRPLVSPIFSSADETGKVILDPSGLWENDDMVGQAVEYRCRLLAWKAAGTTPLVGVVGALTARKCVDELIDAAMSTGAFRLLLAGVPDIGFLEHLTTRLRSLPDGVVFADLRRLTEAELDAAVATVDCLALLYSNRVGSSGILARAVRQSTPVVAWGNDTVVGATKSQGLGAVAPSLEPDELTTAIAAASRVTLSHTPGDLRDGVRESWRALLLG